MICVAVLIWLIGCGIGEFGGGLGGGIGVNAVTTGGTGAPPSPAPDPPPAPAPDPPPAPSPAPSPSPTPSSTTTGTGGGITGTPTTTSDGGTTGTGYNKYDYFGNFGIWLKEHFFIWWQGLLICLAMLFVLMVVVWSCYAFCFFRVCHKPKKPNVPYELLVGKVGDRK